MPAHEPLVVVPVVAVAGVALRVDDLDAEYKRLGDAGVSFLDEPHVIHRDNSGELWMVFLVDPDGVIQFNEVTAEGIGRNAAELVRKVKAAIYVRNHPGEVCPAKWEEGEDTLAPSLDLVGKI